MKTILRTLKMAAPSLKLVGKGALIGGVPLFLIATVAFGIFSGSYGLPTPRAEVDDLTTSISQAFTFSDQQEANR